MMPSLLLREMSACMFARKVDRVDKAGGCSCGQSANGGELTWIPGVTVGTDIVARHVLYKVVKRLLIARLLALAERAIHGHGEGGGEAKDADQTTGNARCTRC